MKKLKRHLDTRELLREPANKIGILSITNSRYLVNDFLYSHIGKTAEKLTKEEAILKILDVGCGSKPYRPYFRKTDVYHGLDRTKKLKVTDIQAVAEYIPFRDGSFTCVLCTQVLEHLTSPCMHALEEIHRVMKTKGQLILSAPGIWLEGHGRVSPDFWRWTAEGLTLTLHLLGFKLQELYSMDPITSMGQLVHFYIPRGKISKTIIHPCLNVVVKVLSKLILRSPLFRHSPRLHVVHIAVASKK